MLSLSVRSGLVFFGGEIGFSQSQPGFATFRAVEILGIQMSTDLPSTFEEKSCIKAVGFDMTSAAAKALYSTTGLTPKDVQVKGVLVEQ